jgi:cadmium resistance protein CadD (predicted permease)
LLTVLGISVATFIGTSIDNLVILALLRASGVPGSQANVGFALGSAVVLMLSAAAIGIAELVPVRYLAWIGLLPLLLGLNGLRDLFLPGEPATASPVKSSVLPIAGLQIASSLDTLIAFAPLIAETVWPLWLGILAAFALMTLAWISLAGWIADRSTITRRLGRVGSVLRPIVLIAVGLYVLLDTGSDREPGSQADAAAAPWHGPRETRPAQVRIRPHTLSPLSFGIGT